MLGYFRQICSRYFQTNIVIYFFMILIFVVGVVVGALAVKTLPNEEKSQLINDLHIFFIGLTQSVGNGTYGSHIIGSVVSTNVKMIILMWILGFTIIGTPFVLFIL